MVLKKPRLKFSNRRALELAIRKKRKRESITKIKRFQFEINILQREINNLNFKIEKLRLIR